MNWLTKLKKIGENIKTVVRKRASKEEVANSDWTSCCKGPVRKKDLEESFWVCKSCNKHFMLSCRQRMDIFFGKNNYEILDYPSPTPDPINFPGYKDKLDKAKKITGQKSAFMVCAGKINNINVTAIASDFKFIGGSLGSHETEAFLVAIQHAITNNNPVINFTTGGGIRVQENLIGLSGMVRTTLAVNELKKNNGIYINVLCHPTAGGQAASYAMLGDFNFAEPGATISFAGRRVIEATVREELPVGFQTSEHVLKSGFIDSIFQRKDLKDKIGSILSILLKKNSAIKSVENETTESNTALTEAS